MISICNSEIVVQMIYKEILNLDLFPLMWKRRNIVPMHKKRHKRHNFQPVLLLPILGKC